MSSFYLAGSAWFLLQCAHLSLAVSFLPGREDERLSGEVLNVVRVSKNSCVCISFSVPIIIIALLLGIGRGASGLRGGPSNGIFALEGAELIEGLGVGMDDSTELAWGPGVGTDDDPGLAKGLIVGTGDGSGSDEGPADCAGLRNGLSDSMSA